MTQRNGGTTTWELTAPPGAVDPSPDLLDLLVHGDLLRRPDAVAASALLGLWNAGWTWDQAVGVVSHCPALAADVAKLSRGLGWLWRIQRWCADVATDAPNGDRANAVRADLADAVARIQVRQWPRRQGHRVSATSVTSVALACVKVAGRAGRTTGLHLSVRTVAEAAAVGVGTAQAALGYLQAERVLIRQDRARVRNGAARAATYSLQVDLTTLPDDRPDDDDRPGVPTGVTELLAHDCWRWGGLGASAGQVWALLDDRVPLTAEAVAGLRDRSATWTRRLLARLSLHGLAVRRGDTWTRCTVAEARHRLDVAARHVGTAGKGDQQRARHAAEREQWAEQRRRWLATQARDLQARHAHTGVTWDPGTGVWVDLETGEVVPPPTADVLPPLEPVGLTAAELQQWQADAAAEQAEQRRRDALASADRDRRSAALAERLHRRLDERTEQSVAVTGWTVDGVAQPLPDAATPLTVDYGALQGRDVRLQLAVVPQVLALQRQAEQWAAAFARVAALGQPLQDLAEQLQVSADRVAQWAAARDGGDT